MRRIEMINLTFQEFLSADFRLYKNNPVIHNPAYSPVIADPSVLTPEISHDGKWHHLAVAHDPNRKGGEYTLWLDWQDESSPRRFTSDYGKDAGASNCVLPFSISKGKATLGGDVGFGPFAIGYRGLVDDVAVFDQPLSSAELSVFLTSTNRIKSAK